MFATQFKSEGKFLMLTSVISIFAVCTVNISALLIYEAQKGSSGVSFVDFLSEILLFFALFTFVVFGIKGFFEAYAKRMANIVIAVTGSILAIVIISLANTVLKIG